MASVDSPEIAAESLACASVVPSARRISSRHLGWHALLLDVHTGIAPERAEPYQSVATPDQVIGVAIRGRYASEVYHEGRWRRGVYQPGSICLHTRNESRRYRFTPRDYGNASTALIFLPEVLVLATAEHYRKPGHACAAPVFQLQADRDPAIHHVTESLLLAMERGLDNLYAECAAAWLAVHLATRCLAADPDADRRRAGRLLDARLDRVLEFMGQRFADDLTLDQLAAEACVSKYHFARLFKERTGQTPHSYLTGLRLDHARMLLLATGASISGIAASCGFARPSHFSVAFAARYGVAPSVYRALRGSRLPMGPATA